MGPRLLRVDARPGLRGSVREARGVQSAVRALVHARKTSRPRETHLEDERDLLGEVIDDMAPRYRHRPVVPIQMSSPARKILAWNPKVLVKGK